MGRTGMVAGGAKHSACVTRRGRLYTWGHGDNGRLGNGAKRGTLLPEPVAALLGVHVVHAACPSAQKRSHSDI